MRWCPYILLGSLLLLSGVAKTPEAVRIRVENRSAFARPDELVEPAWTPLVQRLPGLTPEQVRVRDEVSGRLVPHQVVDAHSNRTLCFFWFSFGRTKSVSIG